MAVTASAPLRATLTVIVPLATLATASAPERSTVTADAPVRSTQTASAPVRSTLTLEVDADSLPEAERSVIVFLLDDIGIEQFTEYSAYHQWASSYSFPPTPRIAAIAAAGVQFNWAHASSVCSPTRVQILTGLKAHNSGITAAVNANDATKSGKKLPKDNLVSRLTNKGLRTRRAHAVGKWHLGWGQSDKTSPDFDGGFDTYGGCLTNHQGADDLTTDPSYVKWTKTEWDGTTITQTPNTTEHSLLYKEARCIDIIEAAAAADESFLLYVAFNAPHVPLGWTDMGGEQLHTLGYHSFGATDPGENNRRFAALVESMDTAIGNILDAMTADQAASTMIVVMGDNGTDGLVIDDSQASVPSGYSTSQVKRSLYEGGIRVPLWISGPQVVSGGRNTDALVDAYDVGTTIERWIGGNPLQSTHPTDGVDLAGVLKNESSYTKPYSIQTYAQLEETVGVPGDQPYGLGWRMMVQDTSHWKLMQTEDEEPPANSTEPQLYDLNTDPQELTNLYSKTMTAPQQEAFDRLEAYLNGEGLELSKP